MERKGIIRHLKVLKRKGKVKKWTFNRYSSPGFYFIVMLDEFKQNAKVFYSSDIRRVGDIDGYLIKKII